MIIDRAAISLSLNLVVMSNSSSMQCWIKDAEERNATAGQTNQSTSPGRHGCCRWRLSARVAIGTAAPSRWPPMRHHVATNSCRRPCLGHSIPFEFQVLFISVQSTEAWATRIEPAATSPPSRRYRHRCWSPWIATLAAACLTHAVCWLVPEGPHRPIDAWHCFPSEWQRRQIRQLS